MGLRFRKSIKILPGVKLNVTQKGISSASIGKAGASINIGKKGTRTTVGIPGSGLSYSKYQSYNKSDNAVGSSPQSSPIEENTSPDLNPSSAQNSSNSSIGIGTIVICVVIAFILGAIIF